MPLYHLRKIRILVSLVFFVAILFVFLGIALPLIAPLGDGLLQLQLFPSVLRMLALSFGTAATGFVLVILLTLLFGRVYCSSICPMGTLQDMITALSRQFRKRKTQRFRYTSNRKNLLRYSILAATVLLWAGGSLFLLNLLDPYANFGKFSVSLFHPATIWINNTLAFTLERFDVFAVAPMSMHALPLDVVAVSVGLFAVVGTMAAWRGRLFCNTICPAGSALGLLAGHSVYRIGFHEQACTHCGKCERVCKAECLDSRAKKVDQSRCINCFNCFASCPNQGLYYELRKKSGPVRQPANSDKGKRQFLLTLAGGLASIPMGLKFAAARQGHAVLAGRQQRRHLHHRGGAGSIPIDSQLPVTPPGSLSHSHFTSHCIACYLCVSTCPTKVIVPSFFTFGLEGFMQPRLDFHRSFCNYDCVRCTEVCPTGAITHQTPGQKRLIQTGVVRFQVESCIVVADRTDCGACSEHCPTKAVQMVPYRDGLFIPRLTPSLCVGCGACEFACPTEPYKAIYVNGRTVHQPARPVEDDEGPREEVPDEFPF